MNKRDAAKAFKQMITEVFENTLTDYSVSTAELPNHGIKVIVEYQREGAWNGYVVKFEDYDTTVKKAEK